MEKSVVDYLRISITDKCNLRCTYCNPLREEEMVTHNDVLRYEEMNQLVRYFTECGVSKVRITGGEPLIKKGIEKFIGLLHENPLIKDIALTTNGVLLEEKGESLVKNGANRLNISLDSLNRKRFLAITGVDALDKVLKGIRIAKESNFSSVKLNVVVLKDVNDKEILDFINFSISEKIIIRFIESFHTNRYNKQFLSSFVSEHTIKQCIEQKYGPLVTCKENLGNGPAHYYYVGDRQTVIGFISNNTKNFCQTCNRMRITFDGKIMPCLFSNYSIDAKKLIKNGQDPERIKETIKRCMDTKRNYQKSHDSECDFQMHKIGG